MSEEDELDKVYTLLVLCDDADTMKARVDLLGT